MWKVQGNVPEPYLGSIPLWSSSYQSERSPGLDTSVRNLCPVGSPWVQLDRLFQKCLRQVCHMKLLRKVAEFGSPGLVWKTIFPLSLFFPELKLIMRLWGGQCSSQGLQSCQKNIPALTRKPNSSWTSRFSQREFFSDEWGWEFRLQGMTL